MMSNFGRTMFPRAGHPSMDLLEWQRQNLAHKVKVGIISGDTGRVHGPRAPLTPREAALVREQGMTPDAARHYFARGSVRHEQICHWDGSPCNHFTN